MLRSVLLMTILASSSSVLGKEISYDFIQGGYINTYGSDPVKPSGSDPVLSGDGFEFFGKDIDK